MKFIRILLCVFLLNFIVVDAYAFSYQSEICIYVSPYGDDEIGKGTLNEPYASLKRAQKDVRLWLKSGTKNDINVVLRGGEYQLTEEFLITEAYSVNDKQKIIYRAYKDEIPVISGGKALTKWEKYSENIYYTDVDDAVYSLFEDVQHREKEQKLSQVMDRIRGAYGKNALTLASQGGAQVYVSSNHKSPAYTTQWSDLPKVTVR